MHLMLVDSFNNVSVETLQLGKQLEMVAKAILARKPFLYYRTNILRSV